MHRTRTIAAGIGDIWIVLADFGSISSWAENADHSCILFFGPDRGPVGTSRRVQMKRDTLVERITEFDPPRALAYDVEGLPRLFRRVTNRWTLASTGEEQTHVTLTSTVEIGSHATQKLTERALCRLVARQSDSMLAGLANRLEKARV
jgi:hypothetical protein